MSFKSIMALFREDDWSSEMVEMLSEMLELSGDMFTYTRQVLVDGAPDTDPGESIFERDKRINSLMRQIRRRVITRLGVGGQRGEVPTALIFFNAVKDAERIGDYIKNIYEIVDMQPDQPDRALYAAWLGERSQMIEKLMVRTREAFAESDDPAAADVIAETRRLGRDCETAIREITDGDFLVRDAVCLVLALRFFKRISSHLSNIATTVVMPVDLLDFHDEKP
jgi:phosphate uptake regulator